MKGSINGVHIQICFTKLSQSTMISIWWQMGLWFTNNMVRRTHPAIFRPMYHFFDHSNPSRLYIIWVQLRSGVDNGRYLAWPKNVTAPAAWKFCSWGTTNALDWFHVWKWRLNVLFESPTPWQHTYTQYMGVQFTLGWHCGSHTRAQALPFCHDGVDEKTFWVFDVTAFFSSVYFWLLTKENGSCVAQLPHAPFKNEKYTQEVTQLECAIFSLSVQEICSWAQLDPYRVPPVLPGYPYPYPGTAGVAGTRTRTRNRDPYL